LPGQGGEKYDSSSFLRLPWLRPTHPKAPGLGNLVCRRSAFGFFGFSASRWPGIEIPHHAGELPKWFRSDLYDYALSTHSLPGHAAVWAAAFALLIWLFLPATESAANDWRLVGAVRTGFCDLLCIAPDLTLALVWFQTHQ